MAHPNRSVAAFSERVEGLLERDNVDSFWKCEEALRELLKTNFVIEVLNSELLRIAGSPTYLGDWRPKQLTIYRGPGYTLSLSTFHGSRRYIHTAPFLGMFAPVGGISLEYSRYRLPKNYRNDVFYPNIRLERAGSGSVAVGEVLEIRSREYAYDFNVSESLLVLKFTSEAFESLEWLFNRENLSPWQANDAEVVSTQLRVASYVLGRLAHQSSLETLETLAAHRHHAVRWAAIQGLGRLSRTVALQKLERALSDPHPHIRKAAEKTLRQLSGKVSV